MMKLSKLPILFIFVVCPALLAEEVYTFKNDRQPGQIDRVEVLLEVGGEFIVPTSEKEQRDKMSVVSNFVYDEKTLKVPDDSSGVARSLRWYDTAEAVVKIGDEGFRPRLRAQRRLLAVAIPGEAVPFFSPRGPLLGEELDLMDFPGNSLLLDRFLPEKPVEVGEKWGLSEEVLAPFCRLDVVGKSDVQCMLKEVTEAVARFEMSGRVLGAIHGATSEIELKARYRVDRRRGRIDWCGMLVRERRQSSFVMDGLDVVARLQIVVKPQGAAEQLADAAVADLTLKPTAELLQVVEVSRNKMLEITHDRQWHVYNDFPELMVLRRVEKGELKVQCNFSPLPKGDPQKLISLEKFQKDVQKGLGNDFGEFLEASQKPDPAQRRVLKVIVRGNAKPLDQAATSTGKKTLVLPMRWIYYHVADAEGRQAVFAFALEEKYFDKLDNVDQELVGSLKFLNPPKGKKTQEEEEKE